MTALILLFLLVILVAWACSDQQVRMLFQRHLKDVARSSYPVRRWF